jgi:hypothetical protein
MPVNGQKNGAAASNTSSRTSDWKAAFDTVICPLCGAPTVQAFINAHIDSQCQKHIRTIASPPQPRPQQPQRPKRAAPSDAAVPRPSRPRMLGHASHCRPNDPAAAAAAHVAAARYLRPSTLELPRARLQPLTADGASWVLHVPGWGRFDDRPSSGARESRHVWERADVRTLQPDVRRRLRVQRTDCPCEAADRGGGRPSPDEMFPTYLSACAPRVAATAWRRGRVMCACGTERGAAELVRGRSPLHGRTL